VAATGPPVPRKRVIHHSVGELLMMMEKIECGTRDPAESDLVTKSPNHTPIFVQKRTHNTLPFVHFRVQRTVRQKVGSVIRRKLRHEAMVRHSPDGGIS